MLTLALRPTVSAISGRSTPLTSELSSAATDDGEDDGDSESDGMDDDDEDEGDDDFATNARDKQAMKLSRKKARAAKKNKKLASARAGSSSAPHRRKASPRSDDGFDPSRISSRTGKRVTYKEDAQYDNDEDSDPFEDRLDSGGAGGYGGADGAVEDDDTTIEQVCGHEVDENKPADEEEKPKENLRFIIKWKGESAQRQKGCTVC